MRRVYERCSQRNEISVKLSLGLSTLSLVLSTFFNSVRASINFSSRSCNSEGMQVSKTQTPTFRTRQNTSAIKLPAKLSKTEADLLRHLQNGYQIETNSLETGPLLRRLKDNEVIRTASANRNTIKALEDRGLIGPVTSPDLLTSVWRLKQEKKQR